MKTPVASESLFQLTNGLHKNIFFHAQYILYCHKNKFAMVIKLWVKQKVVLAFLAKLTTT